MSASIHKSSMNERVPRLRPKFSAFLSASTDPQDERVVDWFSNLLKEFDIEPIFATNLPEPRPAKDKIEDLIRKSDMFVAVVTRRDKIEGKNLWKGPEWVQNEIAIAHTLKKPIALFVEQDVQIDRSIVPYIADYVRFDREILDSIREKAQKFIHALCDRVGTRKAEEDIVDQTIVEEAEEGLIESTIIRLARRTLLWRYGRLDVSLKIFYIIILLLLPIPTYIAYDYFFGAKISGQWGGMVSLLAIFLMVGIAYLAMVTRCKECRSYFSERRRPITYGDQKKFPDLRKNRRLLKFQCEVCGNVRYDTRERGG